MRIFGRALSQGSYIIESGGARTEYAVEKRQTGFKVTGKAQGRLGRVEVFRGRTPREFLLNNWQSWGPFQNRNWGKKICALDTTRPDVKEWLREIFSALRRMGFSYFKVDLLFAAAMPGERVQKGTPIQAYREGMKTIREAVGDGSILGCGAPLLPSAGFVEGMRVGEVRLIANLSDRSNEYEAIKVPPRSARLLRGPA